MTQTPELCVFFCLFFIKKIFAFRSIPGDIKKSAIRQAKLASDQAGENKGYSSQQACGHFTTTAVTGDSKRDLLLHDTVKV